MEQNPNRLTVWSISEIVTFTVFGEPIPQGSKTAGVTKTGRPFMREARAGALHAWRAAIADAAGKAMEGRPVLDVAVGVAVDVFRQRPRAHYRVDGERLNALGRRHPRPDSKPDLPKLVRAVHDAMSGIVYTDDSRICRSREDKQWGTPERIEVIVWLL